MTRDEAIAESRAKLEDLCAKFTAEDFARVITKFFTAVIVTEQAFERRFPAEYKLWAKEYYGDE